MTLTWSSSLDSWQVLKLELQLEAEAIFASSGEVVVVTPDSESDSVLTLVSRTRSLKLTFSPERNAVRDGPDERGFDGFLTRPLHWRALSCGGHGDDRSFSVKLDDG
jgi:hypothetical protein